MGFYSCTADQTFQNYDLTNLKWQTIGVHVMNEDDNYIFNMVQASFLHLLFQKDWP